jgi:hypothetical protein
MLKPISLLFFADIFLKDRIFVLFWFLPPSPSVPLECYVTGVMVIPYPSYGCIITLVIGTNHVYFISIGDFLK